MRTIVNLVDDYRPGGIRSLLEDMEKTGFSRMLEWQVKVVDSSAPVRLDGQVDVIVIHYSMAWRKLPALLWLRRAHRNARLIIVEHHYTRSFEQQHVKRPSRFRTMLRLCYRLADHVVSVSDAQAAWMRSSGLVSASRLLTIPSCRDYARFLAIPRRRERDGPIVVGAFGRLVHTKGFDVLIEAMCLLSADRFLLRIAGDGEQAAQLRELAGGLCNVEFLGHLDDPSEFLAGCDVLAVPSRTEAFGLVCAEGKAAGLPVVVSNVDALPAQAAGCGIAVKPEDPIALSSALEYVTRPERISRYGESARSSVVNAWPNYLSAWSELLS